MRFVAAMLASGFVTVSPIAAQTAGNRGPERAVITGSVFDSVSSRPLIGARVSVEGTSLVATSDSAGAYRLAGVPPGEHDLVLRHPVLDTLGWYFTPRRIAVGAGESVAIDLATPSWTTLLAAECPTGEGRGTGAVVGFVHEAGSDLPLTTARVALSWTDESGASQRMESSADRRGAFRFCSVPVQRALTAEATFGEHGSGAVPLIVDADQASRRDLSVPITVTAPISGTVVNALAGTPLAHAVVRLVDTPHASITDADGRFELAHVTPGTYRLLVEHVSFAPTSEAVELGPGEALFLQIPMAEDVITLEGIDVAVNRRRLQARLMNGFYERMRVGVGQFVTREDLVRRKATLLTDVLRTVPGVDVVGTMEDTHVVIGRAQLGRYCPAQLFIDGVLNPFGATMLDGIAPESIEAIEVYRGLSEVPAEFANDMARCGVIAIWTRRGR